MNLRKQFLTKNKCYISGRKIKPTGIVVHSTGCNNPMLNRYVAPDDGLLGRVSSANWNQPLPGGREVCVHAFIGKLKDGSVATYQTLPWDTRGWHGGSGKNGSVNDTHIGFEICEDGLDDADYFAKVYREAAELCAMLCKEYGIKPISPSLICHSEGYRLGIASNHADVMHWLPKYGKSMDTFRADVAALLGGDANKNGAEIKAEVDAIIAAMESAGMSFDKAVWVTVLAGAAAVPMEYVPTLINRAVASRNDISAAELRALLSIILKI